jgi:GDSL-like Lipase/Acylhydrolase family
MYFLGDSFTGDSTSSNAISGSYWAQQLMTHLRDDWFDAGQFSAVPGTALENFLGYSPAPSTFVNAAAPMSVCVVLGGANNFNTGDSAATAYAKLQTLVGTLKGYGYKVLVCSLFSGNIVGGPASLSNGDYDVLRDAFNVLVRTNWRTFADGFIDFAANQLMGKDGDYASATYYSDQLHPTNTGKLEHLYHAVGPISDVVFAGGTGGGSGGAFSRIFTGF